MPSRVIPAGDLTTVLALALALAGAMLIAPAKAKADYHRITPDAGDRVITLTGHDLTIEEVVAVARHGAQVRYSAQAIQRAADGMALRAEAGAENIPVYGLNRGPGAMREVRMKRDEAEGLAGARAGAKEGVLPEIADEDLVRAFLVIRANSVPFEAADAQFMQLLVNLLNKRVTPVMYSRGTLGEGDLFLTSNFLATMVGRGDPYFRGVRMSAAAALEKAGLEPLSTQLLAYDLLTATYWLDVRKAEDPKRNFAPAPTAAWIAFRKVLPWQEEVDSRPDLPYGAVAYGFLKQTPASNYYSSGPAMPATDGQMMAK